MQAATIKMDDNSTKKILDLRKWCYDNVKCDWCTYIINGLEDIYNDEFRQSFVAFEFKSDKEAMKFQLYVGK